LAKQPFLSRNLPEQVLPDLSIPTPIRPPDVHFSVICLQIMCFSLAPDPQPGGPSPCVYVPPLTYPQALASLFCRLLCLARLRWRYSNPPPLGSM
jgi:hypothetical protein